MKVKRFVAADMRRALDLVRQEMGPDAVILSSTRTKSGVEIITSSDGSALAAQGPVTHHIKGGKAVDAPAPLDEIPMNSDVAWGEESTIGRLRKREQEMEANKLARRQLTPSLQTPTALENPSTFVRVNPTKPAATSFEKSFLEAGIARKSVPQSMTPVVKAQPRTLVSEPIETVTERPLPTSVTREPGRMTAPMADGDPNINERTEINSTPNYQPPNYQPIVTQFSVTLDPEYFRQFEPETQPHTESPQEELLALKSEITDMRELLEVQLERLANAKPQPSTALVEGRQKIVSTVAATIERRLQRLGLPKDVRQQLLTGLKIQSSLNDAWTDILANLAHQLPVYRHKILSRGGIYSLVGNTDSGKTATIAKMAARYVLDYGAKGVTVVRFAESECGQSDLLARLGQILQITVHTIDDVSALGYLLHQLNDQRLVLIDTPSYPKKDPRWPVLLASLGNLTQVRHLLAIPANSQTSFMRSSVAAFSSLSLTACVLTKVDAAVNLGAALGVMLNANLPVAYTTTGNDLTQDFGVARAHQLVTRAVTLMKERDMEWSKILTPRPPNTTVGGGADAAIGKGLPQGQMTGQSLTRIYTQ